MSPILSELEGRVAETTTVEGSAVVLLDGLKAKLEQIIADGAKPADVKALADALGASSTSLSEAITRNTPAE